MGDYWSEVTDLVVADIDDDGEVEVAGLVEDGDVYVFDGATKALEAVIAAEGTSLEPIAAGDGTDLLLGDATGHMGIRSFDGSGYPEVGGADFGPEPIEGLSVLGDGGLWVGSGGIMRRFDQVLGGVQTFASANYGEGLGQRVVALPGRPIVFSAGGYGVHAFRVDGPGVQ
jgi:hypothetical protein